jgi:hypothetical protein
MKNNRLISLFSESQIFKIYVASSMSESRGKSSANICCVFMAPKMCEVIKNQFLSRCVLCGRLSWRISSPRRLCRRQRAPLGSTSWTTFSLHAPRSILYSLASAANYISARFCLLLVSFTRWKNGKSRERIGAKREKF